MNMLKCFLLCLAICNGLVEMAINKASKVIIAGGGPVGLGMALMLKKRGYSDVTIIEKRTKDTFETERAYLYLLDGRGQRLTDFLGITPIIANKGVSSYNFKNLTEILTTSALNIKQLPVTTSNVQEKFWISRSAMLSCLIDSANTYGIKILFGLSVDSIFIDNNQTLTIQCIHANGEPIQFQPNLLIGCDGFKSSTRDFLCQLDKENFTPISAPSHAAGLLYKMLTIRSSFPLPKVNVSSDNIYSKPSLTYAIRSTGKTPTTRMSLGLLPVKDDPYRTANIIARPSHEIWTMKSSQQLREFLSKQFPQLLPLDAYFPESELKRFVEARPGEFPAPSSIQKSYMQLSDNCHVLLAGDAVHSFPPDLGQGVNSGFEDVLRLHKSLEETQDDFNTAAVIYDKITIKESQALIDVMSYGYPYQYGHMPGRSKLAILNFGIRYLLSKTMPSIFSPAAASMIQDARISYSEVSRRAHQTTMRIRIMLISFLLIGISVLTPLRSYLHLIVNRGMNMF
jgi:kynurenine 3-monooxygenase